MAEAVKHENIKVSMSGEDYLEAMVMLGADESNAVRSVDVAAKLDVSKASVNKAVSSLKEKGYVTQPHYGHITLTKDGYRYGKNVLNKHNTLTHFLNKGLGIDAETAEEEACKMEHAISDESFEKWVAFLKGLDL